MSIVHRFLSNTIFHFPEKADDLISEYFDGKKTFEKAWTKALVYDQAFINQSQRSNPLNKGKNKVIIQNEDIFSENFIKFACEGNDKLRSNIDSLESMIKDIDNFGKETNEIYIVKELTSKLIKSREIAKHLKSLDDIVSSNLLRTQNRANKSLPMTTFNHQNMYYDYAYIYLFRDSLTHAHFVFDHHHNQHRHHSANSEYKPLWLSQYITKEKRVEMSYGKVQPPGTITQTNNNDGYSATSVTDNNSSQQQRYRQDIQLYGNIIGYTVPSNIIDISLKSWCTYRTLADAIGLGYLNIFPLAYKTEGCVQYPHTNIMNKNKKNTHNNNNDIDNEPPKEYLQLQKPSIKFIIELPIDMKKFHTLNGLLLASFLMNQPAILANWCSQLSAMTEFIMKHVSKVNFPMSMLSPLLEHLFIRPDGRLLLSEIEFCDIPATTSVSQLNTWRNTVEQQCHSFSHSVIASALCLSRTLALASTKTHERYTKKTMMVYLRQESSILITFPELNTSSSQLKLDLRLHSSTSTSITASNSTSLPHKRSTGSNSSSTGMTSSNGNILDIDYNGVNSEGVIDHIAEIRQVSTTGDLSENRQVSTGEWCLMIDAITPGKFLLDISAGTKGINITSQNIPKTIFYEYEIMIVIVPKVASISHKTLETVEITAFIEEAHRMNNLSLLYGSQLFKGGGNSKQYNKSTSTTTLNSGMTTAQLGKTWKHFTTNNTLH